MHNCKEYTRTGIVAIKAIPVERYAVGIRMYQATFAFGNGEKFADTITIPMVGLSGKVTDTEKDGVSGRKHSVSLSCEVDDRDDDIFNDLLKLERKPYHLLLTFRSSSQAFIAATKDSYLCTTSREDAKTTLTFRIENYMGVQSVSGSEPIETSVADSSE